ncbi:hypothetical protein [Pseudoalteromonas luteoviolacea]|uniref:Uncharacterized protein n=1 Tax=Pseudoalteromonas luteoviolacea S4054 TaxID=1129367 RepID=A0A0F6AHH6_9GAMM|nr:hypothetical protein [Pseudoalteromonas luteoviolacea]AOT08713.1 hypothetical protein S4054249_13000 [Pseudoalteromonas luteoviolacea]AOT13628.1 hypothetical protein S40542_12975 [Pseudoalteromonas luteoviolacea]AOT18541.1 hypothetical protein S4054_12975 [Pseudoalteromonas luteoviolacea]KKE85608.1 hypothetical protein N479_25675 [Pseudoalteromonas luteoviolacea S4054]KZN71983.1 hypothetical protein N481_16360 [Pseudoalteromonas luteoviolacea S4047-1]
MFKKILKGLGAILLVFVVFFTVIGGWTVYKSSEYEKTAIPYMDVAIRDISSWQVETMKGYLVKTTLDGVSDEDLQKIVKGLSNMGNLIELGEYQFKSVSKKAMAGGESGTFVSYTVPAKYEKGDATLTITLKVVEDSFLVYSFNLNSLALLD